MAYMVKKHHKSSDTKGYCMPPNETMEIPLDNKEEKIQRSHRYIKIYEKNTWDYIILP